jgi:hypothetical protein
MHPTRIFKHPDELKDAWEGYKSFRLKEASKWPKIQYVGKDGNRVEDYPVLPLTMDGFEVYCIDNHGHVHHYFENKEGYYVVFGDICSRIKREIRDHQITGGMLGQFNPSITQRLNGLVDKTQTDIKVEQPLFPDEQKKIE